VESAGILMKLKKLNKAGKMSAPQKRQMKKIKTLGL